MNRRNRKPPSKKNYGAATFKAHGSIADWDDPFGDDSGIDPFTGEQREGAIINLRNSVDVELIRDRHRRLLPYFEALQKAADELLREASLLDIITSQRNVRYEILYRRPDHPNILQTFQHNTSDYSVILTETGDKSHPIIEKSFPVRAVSSLNAQEQQALRNRIQMKAAVRRVDESMMPKHIRVVFPNVIEQITNWLSKIEGPIRDFTYDTCAIQQGPLRSALIEVKYN